MTTDEQRLNAIKARLGSLSPRAQSELYGGLRRLVLEDIPWLLAQAQLGWPTAAPDDAPFDPRTQCGEHQPVMEDMHT